MGEEVAEEEQEEEQKEEQEEEEQEEEQEQGGGTSTLPGKAGILLSMVWWGGSQKWGNMQN